MVKNKVAPPFKQAEFDIVYGEGISRTGDLLDLAVNNGMVDKSGAWYTYNDERIGQGRENAKKYLKEHPELMADLDRKLRLAFGMPVDNGQAGGGQTPAAAQPAGSQNQADLLSLSRRRFIDMSSIPLLDFTG